MRSGYLYVMSEFRTILTNTKASFQIGHPDHCLTIGSCFADNLGQLLQQYKFNSLVNPFGTSYNPISIHKALQYAIGNDSPKPETFGELNETHFNYDFHSSYSNLSKANLEKSLSDTIKKTHEFLKSASILFITYGTAWVYERIDNGEIVSNCHKVPARNFKKQLLTQKKILASFKALHDRLHELNPKLKIILTLSPVRHLKDTLELNAVSKSIVRLSCHTLAELYPNVEYFPAYELVLDDLRDYRFYDRDLLHPSPEAIDYIWKYFGERYFSTETLRFNQQWGEVMKALKHRAYQPNSVEHQKFIGGLISKLEDLKSKINVDKELSQLRSQLKP